MTMPIPKTPEIDEKRKAMVAAAQHYDELQRELGSLRDQLHTAVAGLEAKNSEIAEMRKLLDTQRTELTQLLNDERSNVQIANQARDQAYNERADALGWLCAIEAVIERARDGGDLQPVKKKRNGKETSAPASAGTPAISLADVTGEGGGVPDQGGSAA